MSGFTEYRSAPGISASEIKAALASRAAWWRYTTGRSKPPSKAMELGTALHALLLQDGAGLHVGPDCDRRSNANKERHAAAEAHAALHGLALVSARDYETALALSHSVMTHPVAAAALASCQYREHELTAVVDNVRFKGRLDACQFNPALIVDVKKTRDASPDAFARQVASLNYTVQAAHYVDLVSASTGEPRESIPFVFIAVDDSIEGGAVGAYVLDDAAMARGYELRQRGIDQILAWRAEGDATLQAERGRHYTYGTGPATLSLPGWALRDNGAGAEPASDTDDDTSNPAPADADANDPTEAA